MDKIRSQHEPRLTDSVDDETDKEHISTKQYREDHNCKDDPQQRAEVMLSILVLLVGYTQGSLTVYTPCTVVSYSLSLLSTLLLLKPILLKVKPILLYIQQDPAVLESTSSVLHMDAYAYAYVESSHKKRSLRSRKARRISRCNWNVKDYSKMIGIFVLTLVICCVQGQTTECGDGGVGCKTVFRPSLDSDQDDSKSVDIPINSPGTAKLLTTITGTYDKAKVGPVGSFDTLDFIISKNDEIVAIPLQIAFEFSGRSSQNGIGLVGLRNTGTATRGRWDGDERYRYMSPEFPHWKLFDGPEGNFTIQILQCDLSYEIRIRSPSSPVVNITFNYKSASLWEEYSKYRLSEVNLISINRGDPRPRFRKMVRIESISQCPDARPVLCDEPEVVIHANLSERYTLSCKAYGASFLTSKWRKADKELIHREHIITNDAGPAIVSEVAIPAFSLNDIGMYTCEIVNDFGQKVKKKMSLQYYREISVSPEHEYSFDAEDEVVPEFLWLIEGYPISEPKFNCSSQKGGTVHTDRPSLRRLGDSQPWYRCTLEIAEPINAPDLISCDFFNGSTRVATRTIRKTPSTDGGKSAWTKWQIGQACIFVVVTIVVGGLIIAVCFYHKKWKAEAARNRNNDPDREMQEFIGPAA